MNDTNIEEKKHIRKDNGYWNDDTILQELKEIIEDIGDFPSARFLRKRHKDYLINAMNNNGGILKFREIVNYELKCHPYGYYKDFNIVAKIYRDFENEFHRSSKRDELEKYHKGISAGVKKYHGGHRNVLRKLGMKLYNVENGHWDTFEVLADAINEIAFKIGRTPRTDDLEQESFGLYAATLKYGGLSEVLLRIGYYVGSLSSLESRVKNIFDRYVVATEILDNKKSYLK